MHSCNNKDLRAELSKDPWKTLKHREKKSLFMKLHTDLCNKKKSKKIKVRFTDLTYQVQAWAKDEVKKSKKMERKNWKSVEWGE